MIEITQISIKGPINYETEGAVFCCEELKQAIYSGEYIYTPQFNLKKFGEEESLRKCPYCGEIELAAK